MDSQDYMPELVPYTKAEWRKYEPIIAFRFKSDKAKDEFRAFWDNVGEQAYHEWLDLRGVINGCT